MSLNYPNNRTEKWKAKREAMAEHVEITENEKNEVENLVKVYRTSEPILTENQRDNLASILACKKMDIDYIPSEKYCDSKFLKELVLEYHLIRERIASVEAINVGNN